MPDQDTQDKIDDVLNGPDPSESGEGGSPKAGEGGAGTAGGKPTGDVGGSAGAAGSSNGSPGEKTPGLEALAAMEAEIAAGKAALEAEKAALAADKTATAAEKDRVARFLKAAEALEKGDDEAAAEALWGTRFTVEDVLTKLANAERFKGAPKPVNIAEEVAKALAAEKAKAAEEEKAARDKAIAEAKTKLDAATDSYCSTVQSYVKEHQADYPLFFAWDEDDGVDHEAIIKAAINADPSKCPTPKEILDAIEGRYEKILERTGRAPKRSGGDDFDEQIERMKETAAASRAGKAGEQKTDPEWGYHRALKLLDDLDAEDEANAKLRRTRASS